MDCLWPHADLRRRVPTSSVGLSLAAFIVIYTFLGILDIYLLRKYAKKGPEAAPEAQA